MAWHGRDTIGVVELIFYAPFLLLSAIVCYRHGFSRSSGWLYTFTLCFIRAIGGISQFIAKSNHCTGLLRTILILDSIGLAPLLLGTLGLLSRFVDFINACSNSQFTPRHFKVLQLILFVGTVLAIVGGSGASVDRNGTYKIPMTSKIGVFLYLLGFVGVNVVFGSSLSQVTKIPTKERRIPVAIGLALPFVVVRLIYSILSVFVHNHLFSVATGSATVRLGMAVIEEFAVVAIYVILGMLVDQLDDLTKGLIISRARRSNLDSRGERTSGGAAVDSEAQRLNLYSRPSSPPYAHASAVAS